MIDMSHFDNRTHSGRQVMDSTIGTELGNMG
jgi:hypothetical protein